MSTDKQQKLEANVHRLLIFISIFSFGFSAIASSSGGVQLQVTDNGSSGLTVRFDLSATTTNQQAAGYTALSMTFSDEENEIPVFSRLISVPQGFKAVVRNIERKSTHLGTIAVNFEDVSIPISAHEISGLTLDPPVAVTTGKVEIWRGRAVAPLSIYPVQIVHDDNSVIENQILEFEIVFEPDPSAQNFTPIRDVPGNDFARMIDDIILNHVADDYVDVQQNHRGRMLFLVQDHPLEGENTFFRDNAMPWINQLATWKRDMGFRVEIVLVNYLELSSQQIKSDIILPRYEDEDDPLTYLVLFGGENPEGQVYFPSFHPNSGYDGDHYYSSMNEEDEDEGYLADIAVGRIEVTSIEQLRGAVIRSINYESDPFMDDDEGEWFGRALFTAENIAAAGGQFVPSMMHLGRWVVAKLEQYGYDTVDTLWAEDEDGDIDDAVKAILEDGVGLAVSRGWLTGCFNDDGEDVEIADNRRKTPFIIAVTCLSFETQEGFFQSADRRGLGGPIATIAMKGLSNTTPNNSLLGGSLRGMLQFDLYQAGLIQVFGKYQMWSDNRYDLSAQVFDNVAVFRLMGDPSVQIITKIPIALEADFPERISVGTTGLSIQVASNGESVPDAWVSIYQTDGIHLVCQPGNDGWARFTFAQDELLEGDIGVTITRYNAIPVHGSIQVAVDGERIEMTDIQFQFGDDNDDELFGNGESVLTTLTFTNNGESDFENVMVSLSTDDLHITFPDDQIQIDELATGESAQVEFEIEIDRASQWGRSVRIQAVASSGEFSWESAFSFASSGHKLSIDGSADQNSELRSGNQARFTPELENSGDMRTPEVRATLTSLSSYITINNDEVFYDEIRPEESGSPIQGASFTVEASELAIDGNTANFMLTLRATDEEDNFADTIYFSESIGNADVEDPYGPDEYGYIMFDSGDTDWAKAPVYSWIEINPNKNAGQNDGILLDFEDLAEDFDSTLAVRIPFDGGFQFYGETFDTIAVNSNGWIAFGADKTQYLDFRNQQIPGIQGPDAMVAVFWQDLINYLDNELSGTYYYWDEEAAIFIIEWSALRIFDGGRSVEQVEVQMILYDSSVYPTSTGDGEIKFQYKLASRGGGVHTDNQFSTIGIKNLDGTGGLEYVYWDQYPDANKPLEDGLAILITTDRLSTISGVEGTITRFEDHDAPIVGATVNALRTGVETVTDENGNFSFESILTGRERISVTLDGFNTLIFAVDVVENEVSQVEGRMTHPQIAVHAEEIDRGLHSGDFGVSFNFTFENQGNGPLAFDFSTRYLDSTRTQYAETWTANLSALVEDDNNLIGCQFIGNKIFVSGRADLGDPEDEMIYVFEKNDNGDPILVDSFLQPNQSVDGFYDLASDGRYLYGGEIRHYEVEEGDDVDSLVIVKFDQQGEVIDNIILDINVNLPDTVYMPLDLPYALAYNPRDETLLTTKDGKDIFVFNQDGELVNQIALSIPGSSLKIKGLAWNDNDDDDMPLYIIDLPDGQVGMRLSKANIETSELMVLGNIEGYRLDEATGLTIGWEWESGVLSMASIAGAGSNRPGSRYNDTLRVFEIGPDSHYLKISPKHGILDSGQTAIIRMEMRSTLLPEGTYTHALGITHNGAGEDIIILATLRVNDTLGVNFGENAIPTEFSLAQAFPNPFNNTARIDFALTKAAHTELTIYDISGRRVSQLINEHMEAGKHTALFRPDVQASGIYLYQLKSGSNSAVKRMVYLK